MSQKDLADSTRAIGERQAVSIATVQSIEAGTTSPKPVTLQKLAAGLVRDPFTGGVEQARAEEVYRQLLVAAGHIADRPSEPQSEPGQARRPVEDLTDDEVRDRLTLHSNNPELSANFLAISQDWTELDISAQRFLLWSIEETRRIDAEAKAARSRSPRPLSGPRS